MTLRKLHFASFLLASAAVACSNESSGGGGSGGSNNMGGTSSGGNPSSETGGSNSAGDTGQNLDVCLWSHQVEFSNPIVVTDEGGVCANSELGLDEAGIDAIDGSQTAYGLLPEFQGHADIVLQYDDASASWVPGGAVLYDRMTGAVTFNQTNGSECGYGEAAPDGGMGLGGTEADAGAFLRVGVCGIRFEGTASTDNIEGFQEWYVVSEESREQGVLDEFICTIRFDVTRVGDAPDGCEI